MLHLAREWFGAAVPDDAMTTLRPSDVADEHLRWVRDRVLGRVAGEGEAVGDHTAAFLTARGLRGKAAVLWREAFPGRLRLARAFGLPEASSRLYARYPIYAASRAARGLCEGWRLLTRRESVDRSAKAVSQNVRLRDWLQRPAA